MVLLMIILATLACGVGSVWLAAGVMRLRLLRPQGTRHEGEQHLLSLAAGALLATAFMHLLPEAFESQISPQALFASLLAGLVLFFVLDKAELWHHGHEHHHHGHDDHGHAEHGHHAPDQSGRVGGGSWAVLAGDSVHCFGDGILVASAFVADLRLGLVAALAVLVHEVPHHMGDLVVLRQSASTQAHTGQHSAARLALLKVSLAGFATVLGGLAGYFLVAQWEAYLPYFLTVAGSSFVYVALADLIPQLQRRLGLRQTLAQIAWLLLGLGLVTLVSHLAH